MKNVNLLYCKLAVNVVFPTWLYLQATPSESPYLFHLHIAGLCITLLLSCCAEHCRPVGPVSSCIWAYRHREKTRATSRNNTWRGKSKGTTPPCSCFCSQCLINHTCCLKNMGKNILNTRQNSSKWICWGGGGVYGSVEDRKKPGFPSIRIISPWPRM